MLNNILPVIKIFCVYTLFYFNFAYLTVLTFEIEKQNVTSPTSIANRWVVCWWSRFECKQINIQCRIMDAPVELLLTENIRHFIRTVLLTSDLPNETRDELRKYGGGTRRRSGGDDGRRPRTIPFQLLRSVHDMQLVKGFSPLSIFRPI